MTIVVDPKFSVYSMVERTQQDSTTLSYRRTMSVISYEIENATILEGAKNRIFSSFQRMSKFIPQIPRYKKLAENAESIYVFGIPDVVPPTIDNVTYVFLEEGDQLAKEWFIVSHGPEYHSMLATEELSEIDDPDPERLFKGLWTFDLELVQIVDEWLTSAVDARPLDIPEHKYNNARQAAIMGKSMERLLDRPEIQQLGQSNKPRKDDEIVEGQVKTLVKNKLMPRLEDIASGSAVEEMGEKEVVIFFSDIRDFTRLSETLSATELVQKVINPYIDTVSKAVYQHGGIVDKFLGDGIMAIFGLEDDPNAREGAVKAAIQSMSELRNANSDLHIGMGLAWGKVHVGAVGGHSFNEMTVIGDAVNMAQRLSELGYDGIWLSNEIFEGLSDRQNIESIGQFVLKGKTDPIEVFRYNEIISTNITKIS